MRLQKLLQMVAFVKDLLNLAQNANEIIWDVVVVVSSLHQSPSCGGSRFRPAQSIAILLLVW